MQGGLDLGRTIGWRDDGEHRRKKERQKKVNKKETKKEIKKKQRLK